MVLEKIKQIISEHSDIDINTIDEESTFTDLGLDSLDIVDLVMDVEDEFGVTIDEDSNFRNVGDVVRYIELNQ